MKKIVALGFILALVAPMPTRANTVCPAPRCVDVTVPTTVTVPDARVRVILPEGYASAAKRYPVLYLLHGAGDTYATWTTNTDVLALTRGLDFIVVMPDGGRNASSGWYSDWKDGSRQWETFHTRDLIAHIDSTYRTLGDGHRAIAGLSMGGFGAMTYAARHPGTYAAAASFSGAVDIMYGAPASGAAFAALRPFIGTPDERIWGNQLTDEATWRAHNPTDLAAALRGTALLIATGNGAPGGAHEDPANVGGYAVEQHIWMMNRNFVAALDRAGVPHTDLFYGPGQHAWGYWRDALAWSLPQILNVIA